MRHSSIVAALAILALTSTVPCAAAEKTPAKSPQLEDMATGMELLFQEFLGTPDVQPVFRDQGHGIYSLSVSLDQLGRGSERFAAASAAKPLKNLAVGHMLSEPSSLSTLIHAVVSSVGLDYNVWWAATNEGPDDLTRKTTIVHKGPGGDLKLVNNLLYDAFSVILFFSEVESLHDDEGVFKMSSKISGATRIKSGCRAEN